MIAAVFKIMWLTLWRDKGALILAFVLPGFIFAVFATIFSTASGGKLDLRVALSAQEDSVVAQNLFDIIQKEAVFDLINENIKTPEDIQQVVRLGQADVGVFILEGSPNIGGLKFQIIEDPSREVASSIVKGQIRQLLSDQSQEDTESLFETLSAMPEATASRNVTDQSVTYYIGATIILFLMFAATQGASISIEERHSGISERLMVGPQGALLMLTGKFLFLTVIGFLQAAVIIAVGAVFFNVNIASVFLPLAFLTIGTAMLSSGIALFIASLCHSTTQMHTVSTFLVLLFSAIGGSMVPRFMMPGWLQDIGIFTPNYWVIEGYYGLLARGQSVMSLWPLWSVIFGVSIILLILAAILSHKLMRI